MPATYLEAWPKSSRQLPAYLAKTRNQTRSLLVSACPGLVVFWNLYSILLKKEELPPFFADSLYDEALKIQQRAVVFAWGQPKEKSNPEDLYQATWIIYLRRKYVSMDKELVHAWLLAAWLEFGLAQGESSSLRPGVHDATFDLLNDTDVIAKKNVRLHTTYCRRR